MKLLCVLSAHTLILMLYHHPLVPPDGSEGLLLYVCTKWSRKEIEAADKRRLDELESLRSMRAGSSHSRSTRGGRGIMHQNLIVHAR